MRELPRFFNPCQRRIRIPQLRQPRKRNRVLDCRKRLNEFVSIVVKLKETWVKKKKKNDNNWDNNNY